MKQNIFSVTPHREEVLSLLTAHLPYSLPLLRRIQFMHLPGGCTLTSNILASFSADIPAKDDVFTIAYLDLSRGPETEMWMYSSIEHPDFSGSGTAKGESEEQTLNMMRYIGEVIGEWEAGGEMRQTPGVVLCGTMHEKLLSLLEGRGVVKVVSIPHFKFVFKVENLPSLRVLPEGLEWTTVREEDLPLVISRTEVPRKARTMRLFPSAAVRVLGSEEPVAWGFLGADGSLTTLHVEEQYRGKGLAKAIALKLFRERMEAYGVEAYAHADVATENVASQGVCKSLGGTAEWEDRWVWVDVAALNRQTVK